MKYRIHNFTTFDFDVITEDGGVASIYESDNGYQTMYYQTRLTELDDDLHSTVWDDLGNGKAYVKEWGLQHPERDELIVDALKWLVVGETNWERDDTIFSHVLFN
jgi:hypothetical protein